MWLTQGRDVSQTSPLFNLPIDILNCLFIDELAVDLHHIAAFAITCKAALLLSKPFLLNALRSKFAPWAGTRILFIDDYLPRVEDLPAGFLTNDEVEEVRTTVFRKYPKHRCYSTFAGETFTDVTDFPRPSNYHGSVWQRLDTASLRGRSSPAAAIHAEDRAKFIVLCGAHYDIVARTYAEGDQVLFNLSKGECVRPHLFSALDTMCASGLTIMNALFARICWFGPDPRNNPMRLDAAQREELGRGKWAGDRFCITTLDNMPLTPEGKEWVDVSEETTEFVYHMWRHAERGDTLCDTLAGAGAAKRSRDEDEAKLTKKRKMTSKARKQ